MLQATSTALFPVLQLLTQFSAVFLRTLNRGSVPEATFSLSAQTLNLALTISGSCHGAVARACHCARMHLLTCSRVLFSPRMKTGVFYQTESLRLWSVNHADCSVKDGRVVSSSPQLPSHAGGWADSHIQPIASQTRHSVLYQVRVGTRAGQQSSPQSGTLALVVLAEERAGCTMSPLPMARFTPLVLERASELLAVCLQPDGLRNTTTSNKLDPSRYVGGSPGSNDLALSSTGNLGW